MPRNADSFARRHLLAAAAGLLGAAGSHPAFAQAATGFPSRPVTIVVPFAPGGLADVLPRLMAEKLSRSLGNSVVVENRPGAGGITGARTVASAAPDGHMLLLTDTTLAINPSLYRSLP
jgi:tripartite-type tricarboxylate transporter receptor subunit TctC